MGEKTNISWCDHTFNPWIGCTRVSPGCMHCYAETQNRFYKWNGGTWGVDAPRKVTADANWAKLRSWDRAAIAAGARRRVFCASLADVFDEAAPAEVRARLFMRMDECHRGLEFLVLTKRPQNWEAMLPPFWLKNWPRHVRLGFTAEDQTRWDERSKTASDFQRRWHTTPFFVSVEPMLSLVNILTAPSGYFGWVICGGESGPSARAMEPDWARSLRDQCSYASIPFFFKQWGDYPRGRAAGDGYAAAGWQPIDKGGSVIDGREWKEFPTQV